MEILCTINILALHHHTIRIAVDTTEQYKKYANISNKYRYKITFCLSYQMNS